jgi:Family of unknown function (DUF6325)
MPLTDPIVGPVEWVAVTFPGQELDAAVVTPLAELVDGGTVRLLDAAVVHKDADGVGTELEDEQELSFDAVDGEVLELLSTADLLSIAEGLEDDTTTLVLLWENRWAEPFAEAVRRAHGTLLAHDRVPRENLARALEAARTADTTQA